MTEIAINWFERNCTQANPEQFQALFLDPVNRQVQTDFSIDKINITPEQSARQLNAIRKFMNDYIKSITEV